MTRKQATALIDQLRWLSAMHKGEPELAGKGLAFALESAGLKPLEPCRGQAHSNPHIDHCSLCAPRWGWVGPVEVVR